MNDNRKHFALCFKKSWVVKGQLQFHLCEVVRAATSENSFDWTVLDKFVNAVVLKVSSQAIRFPRARNTSKPNR